MPTIHAFAVERLSAFITRLSMPDGRADRVAAFDENRRAPFALRHTRASRGELDEPEPDCGALAVVGMPPEFSAEVC